MQRGWVVHPGLQASPAHILYQYDILQGLFIGCAAGCNANDETPFNVIHTSVHSDYGYWSAADAAKVISRQQLNKQRYQRELFV